MVGCAQSIPLSNIDRNGSYLRSKVVGDQVMVYPEAPVPLDCAGTMTPPGVESALLCHRTKSIGVSAIEQSLKAFALRRAADELLPPGPRVVDVPIIRGDVEVTADDRGSFRLDQKVC